MNKLYRADITDINGNYLAKTVKSIDIGIKTSDVIDKKKLLLSLNIIFPNKDFDKIDDLANDAFHDFEVDYNPEDWKLMEAKLDNKEHRLSHIWLYKGIEALLLVMILFTAVNFWTLQEDSDRSLVDVDTTDNEYINLPKTKESKNLKILNFFNF